MYVVRPFFGLYTRRNEIWWNPYCGCGENVVGLDAAFVAEVAKSDVVNELCCFEGFFAVVVDVVAVGDVVMGTFGWDDVSVGYLAVGAAAPKAVAVRSTAVFMLSCN